MKKIYAYVITAVVSALVFTAAHWMTGYVFRIFNESHQFSLQESALYGVAVGVIVFIVVYFSGRSKGGKAEKPESDN